MDTKRFLCAGMRFHTLFGALYLQRSALDPSRAPIHDSVSKLRLMHNRRYLLTEVSSSVEGLVWYWAGDEAWTSHEEDAAEVNIVQIAAIMDDMPDSTLTILPIPEGAFP